jgi:hypothetical protein
MNIDFAMAPKHSKEYQSKIYRFDASIIIQDKVDSGFIELVENFTKEFRIELEQQYFNFAPYPLQVGVSDQFASMTAFVVKRIAARYNVETYCSEFRYRPGSMIAMFVLFMETGIFYSHLREATDKIAEDLEALFSIRGRYLVKVGLNPKHFPEQELAPAVPSPNKFRKPLIISSVIIFLCFLAAVVYYVFPSKEEHFGIPEKIEIVIRQEGRTNIEQQATDSVDRPAMHRK